MRRMVQVVAGLFLVVSLLVIPVAPVVAQEEKGVEEGGIEGIIGEFVEGPGLVQEFLVLTAGIVLLIAGVERLISYLTRAALGLDISLLLLAIVFTGIEFDDTVLALALSAGDLEGAALGTALGTALAIIGVTLAVAALVEPFPVELPTDYLVLFAGAPIMLVPFLFLDPLTLVHGVILVVAFVFIFGYIISRELQRDEPTFRSSDIGRELHTDGGVTLPKAVAPIAEDRLMQDSRWSKVLWLVFAVIALGVVVFASMLLEGGSESTIEGLGISETVWGATILTAILTFEDIMLTLEPVRRGIPEIGIGNVIGSVIFSVTANIGVIMVFSELTIADSVLTYHMPVIIVMTVLGAYFISRQQIERWHGAVLGLMYIGYWAVAYLWYGGAPISG